MVGGLDNDPKIQKILWNSIPYRQDDETWCVATARPRELWRNIFGIYTLQTWIALIVVIFLIGLIVYGLIHIEYKSENYIWSWLIALASTLGLYASYEPTRTSVRMMMLFFFMYGLVMTSSFNSFLISILTRPRYKTQVSSVRMAIEQEFEFAGGSVALSHYTDDGEVCFIINYPNLIQIIQYIAVLFRRCHATFEIISRYVKAILTYA